jgi:predicted nucleic acid-binding protein
VEWLEGISGGQLHLSAVTVGEIQAGIEIARDQDAAKAQELESWLDSVQASYNVLPLDGQVFQEWARSNAQKVSDYN